MIPERKRIARKTTWQGRLLKQIEEPWPNDIRLIVVLGLAVCSWMVVLLLVGLLHAVDPVDVLAFIHERIVP